MWSWDEFSSWAETLHSKVVWWNAETQQSFVVILLHKTSLWSNAEIYLQTSIQIAQGRIFEFVMDILLVFAAKWQQKEIDI